MLEVAVAVGICLVILGTWFVLQIGVAELILALLVLGAGAIGVYWLWSGRRVSEIVEGVGIFALLVIILGLMRLGIEKLSDTFQRPLVPRTKPPSGTENKTRRKAPPSAT